MGNSGAPRRGYCSPRRACDCLRPVFMFGVNLVARFVIVYGLHRGPLYDLFESVIA